MNETLPRIALGAKVLYVGLYSANGKSHQLLKAISEMSKVERSNAPALIVTHIFAATKLLKSKRKDSLKPPSFRERGWGRGKNGM